MRKAIVMSVVILTLILAQYVAAQEGPEIYITDIELSNLRWGMRSASFSATNNSDGPKFLAVVANIEFSGSYLQPTRTHKSFVTLGPSETKQVEAGIDIPGNYGQASIKVEIYDVVDTNDIILPQQKFHEQPFFINYTCPTSIITYFQEKITMPPRVENHPDFDNEFSRVLLYLLTEGKSVEEIAEMAMADESFVVETIERLTARGYLGEKDGRAVPLFPVVNTREAEAVKPLAVSTAVALADKIKGNFPAYGDKLKEMAQSGKITSDRNEFLDPGSVLYHRYPTVAAFLLWFDLGQKFIIDREALDIYKKTDPCDANIQYFMYATQGGDVFNGNHFFHQYGTHRGYSTFYGDPVPVLDCADFVGYSDSHRHRIRWGYTNEYKPEDFMYDSSLVREAMSALDQGIEPLLSEAEADLTNIASTFDRTSITFGYRYWFWNQVATRALNQLVSDGELTRDGNGQYRFIGSK